MEPRLLIRPAEAAQLMGLSRSKIYDLISTGEIPVVRIHKSVRIPMDALRHWIETHTSGVDQHSTPNGVDSPKASR